MKSLRLVGLMALMIGAAQAEVTGTVTATSDYDFRGISQTDEDPALQASVDWESDSGWYASLWGSNVDFGDCCDSDVEVDAAFGYAGGNEEGLGWDVGLVYYSYWPDDDDINYPEIYAGLNYKMFDAKVWYSNDYANTSDPSTYIEGNAAIPLPEEIELRLHLGHYSGDGIEGEVGDSYLDYSAGVARSFGNFDLELKYVDTDIDEPEVGDGRFIFSVSTTFPWSSE